MIFSGEGLPSYIAAGASLVIAALSVYTAVTSRRVHQMVNSQHDEILDVVAQRDTTISTQTATIADQAHTIAGHDETESN